MSIQIRSLTTNANDGTRLAADTTADTMDSFNFLPGDAATKVYTLYEAPASRAAIVKSIRLTNRKANGAHVTLYFNRPRKVGDVALYRRRLLTPEDLFLPSGFTYIDEGELTMEPGDIIQGKSDVPDAIEYLLSGVERDVT